MLRFRPRDTFFTRFTLLLGLAMVALALSASLITGWLITSRLQALIIDYALHTTGQMAANSAFAFLVEDLSVAQRAVSHLRMFPGVRHAAVLRPDYSLIVAAGDPIIMPPAIPDEAREAPLLVGRDDRHWHFVAPVRTIPLVSPYESNPPGSEHLGYIYVAWDRSSVTEIQALIIVGTVTISVGLAFVLLAWLRPRLARLTQPLTDLVQVMQQAHASINGVRSPVAGPSETQEIARVFNVLMENLERHRASLETQVQIRTSELAAARDAALTANRHKSEFMAAITHEMRTPLHAITGYTQLVLEEIQFLEGQEQSIEWLTTVLRAANDLLFRINQILDLARAEAGKLEVSLTRVDLRPLVAHIMDTLNPLLLNRRNRLQVTCHDQPWFLTDQDKLSQILLNLLTNACKFTQDGAIALEIQCSDQALTIEVTDTGIGIPLAQQTLIFEPFRQVDMSDTRKYQGTGLGLAITKRFCELLGGTVTVQSQVGIGSTFTVTLPHPESDVLSERLSSCERPHAGAASPMPEAPPADPAPAVTDTRE